jgi:sugar O-acyltransferase (sialic acid O-acetyltransferase NeuD family)
MSSDYPTVVIYGTGGQAKVVKEILSLRNIPIAGFMDPRPEKAGTLFLERPVFGSEKLLSSGNPPFATCVIAVGKGNVREELGEVFAKYSIPVISVVHPNAVISPYATLSQGTMVSAGAIIGPGVKISKSVIVNTGAIVDNDCILGSYSQVAPGAVLCGGVNVGALSYIGAGATVIQGINIGSNSMIGAGAVVVDDVPDNVVVVGVPAIIIDSWPIKGTLL